MTVLPSSFTALSAVDGRYQKITKSLAAHFSEAALIRWRLRIEIDWLRVVVPVVNPYLWTETTAAALDTIVASLDNEDKIISDIKALENETKHDVKAVEYWLAERLSGIGIPELVPFVHFACTSWDINNIAVAKQLSAAKEQVMLPALSDLLDKLLELAKVHADTPMLSRTHGQPASPTTVGKEFANIAARLKPNMQRLKDFVLPAKINGAVGNYNAHIVAAPHADWPVLARRFIESKNLRFAAYTTQIEPYDELAELFDLLRRINTVLLDCCRDMWGYISLEYFIQPAGGGLETGSSTMPHKVNPIDFENAEGNIGVANALFAHFSDKLPVSRWQRDLSDSTVLRSIGTAFGHTLIAWRATLAGLNKICVNTEKLNADLDANWQVLGEAVQTVLRAAGVADAYEQLKRLSRGKAVSAKDMRDFISQLPLEEALKKRLLTLSPASYCGLASDLARNIDEK